MVEFDFQARAQSLRDDLVAWRRDFHMHPELAFQEARTAGIVAAELSFLGMEVQTGVGKTGVIGILEGDLPGPTVLVRADMDALPIEEVNEVDYISTDPGKMHACGHDAHTAIALGVARLLSAEKSRIAGRVKFVFQPAEEIGRGAAAMVADGAMLDPRPDVSLGLHVWSSMPVGKIGIAAGPVMAAVSDIEIKVIGQGGHGALPHETRDPIVCAAQLVTALQTIASRNVDPFDQIVLSITRIQGGTANNIIPPSVSLSGTLRTFREEVRDEAERRIHEICNGVGAAMQCEVDVELIHHTQSVINDAEVVERAKAVFRRLGTSESDLVAERTTGGEDVGMFMQDVPGLFFFVGSGNEAKGITSPHHHPRFDIDEEVLPFAVCLMTAAVADYVFTSEG